MLLLLFFAFLGGLVTIASPCILPILPVVLSGSLAGGKRRPLGIVTGFILSFTFFTLFLATLVDWLSISADSLRLVAVVVIGAFGLALLVPGLQQKMEQWFSKLGRFRKASDGEEGFWGGVVLGLSIGLVWTPCVGPILASVITLAATSSVTGGAVLITLAYALGTALPMLGIVYGGRQLINRLPWLLSNTQKIQQVFGVIMLAVALAIFFRWDRDFQSWVLDAFPNYGTGLTAFEDNEQVQKALDDLSNRDTKPSNTQPLTAQNQSIEARFGVELNVNPPVAAPALAGLNTWINSDPLSLDELKGKVVLVDFWTYSCINCIRTLPYLKAWHDKYEDDGLVILGVHTPEFAFEKVEANVREAVKDFGLTWPIAMDNNYDTWQAFNNRYWPAKYFIDKQGRIRHTHFGEGAYEESERVIQALLAEDGTAPTDRIASEPETTGYKQTQTPETYLGYARAEHFANVDQFQPDETVTYTPISPLRTNQWTLDGAFELKDENLFPREDGAKLILEFNAADVYLVMGSDTPASVRLTLNGQPLSAEQRGADVNEDSSVEVSTYRLYRLVEADAYLTNADLELTLPEGVELNAFTFGS